VKKPGYGTAKSVLFVLSLVAVLGMLSGGGASIYFLRGLFDGSLLAIPPLAFALATVVASLLLLAVALVGRAVLDNAMMSYDMLSLMRRRWGVTAESAPVAEPAPQGLADVRPEMPSVILRAGKPRPGR